MTPPAPPVWRPWGAGWRGCSPGLDGVDLDLSLEGFAPMIDREGDGVADSLGWSRPTLARGLVGAAPAHRGRAAPDSGSFTADRSPVATP